MPSLVSSTAKKRLHILIKTYYYLSIFFSQIILVPSLVLVLLAEVSRLISMRSYVKIVAADTSYSPMMANLNRR